MTTLLPVSIMLFQSWFCGHCDKYLGVVDLLSWGPGQAPPRVTCPECGCVYIVIRGGEPPLLLLQRWDRDCREARWQP